MKRHPDIDVREVEWPEGLPDPDEEPNEPWARDEGVMRRVARRIDEVFDDDDEHEWPGWEKWRREHGAQA
jgi:hypothetical protein